MERSAEEITVGLDGTWKNGKGQACCPAHDDASPSLSIGEGDAGQLLLHCFSGCSYPDIKHAIQQRGLWPTVQTFPYKSADGKRWTTVRRTDRAGGKNIQPTGKLPPGLSPLYRLSQLLADTSLPILVVEGETTATAAQEYFPDWVTTTSQGGSGAAHKADWTPVKGRRVTIWPDNDEAGQRYAETVVTLCHSAGAAEVAIVAVSDDWPLKWDLGDRIPEGSPADIVYEMVAGAEKVTRGLPVISWAELKAKPVEEVSWLVDGLLRRGHMALFCGDPKAGKSVTARTLVHAMVAGGTWLNREVQRGRVLYMALEESEDDIKEHLAKMNLPDDAEVFLIFETDPTKALERLSENIADLKPDLVVVDTLGDQAKFRKINDYDRALEDIFAFLRGRQKGQLCVTEPAPHPKSGRATGLGGYWFASDTRQA